jgi:tyrosine ammonia-lyase
MTITLNASPTLTPETLAAAAHAEQLTLNLSADALSAIERSHAALQHILQAGKPVYGITTGFGPLVRYDSTNNDAQGMGLIGHLGAGFGAPIQAEVVRSAMLLRLHTLAQGHSGISREAVLAYAKFLESGITPHVPVIGSLGASGDLIPLAHIVRAMPMSDSYSLSGRDALALVNGTSFSTAFAVLALVRMEGLVTRLEELTGWIMRLWQCRRSGLDARLHQAKGHAGQIISARNISAEASKYATSGEMVEDDSRPLQENYSIRCAPQILGAVREVMRSAREMIHQEMSAVDDNPFIDEVSSEAVHGGNFMTQHIAFAADMLNNAITQAGNLAERHVYALTTPEMSGAPLLLAFAPGRTSGMAGVQLTATALVAEMRSHAQCYASSTLPANAGNQDIVPMGFQAARELYAQTERLSGLLACEALCCMQLSFLIGECLAKGVVSPPPEFLQEAMRDFVPLREDRAMYAEITRLAGEMLV